MGQKALAVHPFWLAEQTAFASRSYLAAQLSSRSGQGLVSGVLHGLSWASAHKGIKKPPGEAGAGGDPATGYQVHRPSPVAGAI